jgi:MipA family protein
MKLLSVVVVSLLPLAALAQTPPAEDYTLLGAGARSRPAYDGSASQVVDVIPVVRYYGKPLFARTTQGMLEGGAQWHVARGLALGAQLAYEAGRNKSESGFLRDRDVPDVGAGASIGAHVEWDTQVGPAPLNVLGRFRQNVESSRGAQADLRATLGVYGSGGVTAGVFAQATWASSKAMQTYYQVPGSGLLFVAAGALASWDMTKQWVLLGSVEGRRLQGDAADSPLAERKSNWYASAGVAYKF